jgi:hypothetical protein
MRFHKSSLIKSIGVAFVLAFVFNAQAGSWQEHEAKLATQRQRVKDAEEQIKALIHKKHESNDQSEIKTIIAEIGTEHEAYTKASKILEGEELHVRFKHPEHMEKSLVQYTRHTKSIEELENEIGIDGRLDRIKVKVLATFPIPDHLKQTSAAPKIHPAFRKPASVDDDADQSEHITLTK